MQQRRTGRKKYLVHFRVQIKYVILTISLLIIYTIMLLSVIFLPPVVIFLSKGIPLSEQAEAANAFLLLHNNIWPGIGAIILFFGAVSIFITHRIAGPMFSLRRTIGRIAAGDLKTRVKFRKGDDFPEMTDETNRLAETMELLLIELDRRTKDLSSRVQTLSRDRASAGASELIADVDALRAALAPYRFGEHRGRDADK